jgi:ABC-type multidrug transport system fused ATPase/permease subunit
VDRVAFVRVSYVYPTRHDSAGHGDGVRRRDGASCREEARSRDSASRGGTRLAAPLAGPFALADISFIAPVGTTTALVGPSGAGKTTVLRLLQVFGDPTDGEILVGASGHAQPLHAWDRRVWRRQLGVVGQEPFLFDGTIRDNIAYANSAAGDAAVARAARLAHCDEFVRRLAAGYDTPVGERGVQLSGGQRQRIAIARALLADPPILILDEATSSLDSESELLIQDALRAVERGRTTFVIAHRLATVRKADQILVLERGEIVERGNHDALLARRGRYARAIALQTRAPGADADWVWVTGSGIRPPPVDG